MIIKIIYRLLRMEDENLYDEFGNYIGPDLDESEGSDSGSGDDNNDRSANADSSDYAYEKPVSTLTFN